MICGTLNDTPIIFNYYFDYTETTMSMITVSTTIIGFSLGFLTLFITNINLSSKNKNLENKLITKKT
jgi:uncharacterized membrane protein YciS (DUF1049 family)